MQLDTNGYVVNGSNVLVVFHVSGGSYYKVQWTGSAWVVSEYLTLTLPCEVVTVTADGSGYAQTDTRIVIGIQTDAEWQYYGIMVDNVTITGVSEIV